MGELLITFFKDQDEFIQRRVDVAFMGRVFGYPAKRGTPWSKYMAQYPKGRLIQGLY